MLFKTFDYVRYDFLCNFLLKKGIETYQQLLAYTRTPELEGLRQDEVEMAFSWVKHLSKDGKQAFPSVKYVIFTTIKGN